MKRIALILTICIASVSIYLLQGSELLEFEGGTQLQINGTAYTIKDGNLYRDHGHAYEFIQLLYDIEHINQNYTKDGEHIIAHADGRDIVLPRTLTEDFEDYASIPGIFQAERNWTSMTLLSPGAPTVSAYVQLKNDIIRGKRGFIDNHISLNEQIMHTGKKSLRCFAVNPEGFGKTGWITKSSIDSNLLYIEKGQSFACRAWFYIEKGRPATLMDIEASYILEGPGLRIFVAEDFQPQIELKWADKPKWHCSRNTVLPQQEWFSLELRATLDDQHGQVQLLLNDEEVITGSGQTLPLADSVYDRLELGITANNKGSECILYVDDLHYTSGLSVQPAQNTEADPLLPKPSKKM